MEHRRLRCRCDDVLSMRQQPQCKQSETVYNIRRYGMNRMACGRATSNATRRCPTNDFIEFLLHISFYFYFGWVINFDDAAEEAECCSNNNKLWCRVRAALFPMGITASQWNAIVSVNICVQSNDARQRWTFVRRYLWRPFGHHSIQLIYL